MVRVWLPGSVRLVRWPAACPSITVVEESEVVRITPGRVVSGKVVLEAELEEGTPVSVLSREGTETFLLNPRDEAELLEAIREGELGDSSDGEELLRSLQSG